MQPHELERTATEYMTTAIALGRNACATIVEDTVEYLHGYGDPAELRAIAWRLVGPLFASHLEAQAAWPTVIDSDRLTDAFRELDRSGIVARERFACCQSCGLGEIGMEVLDTAPVRGYVFYNYQDADRAALGGSLWLAYGLFEQPPTAEIGEEVATAVRAAGLDVDWNGSPDQRIRLRLALVRRRHGRLAAFPTTGAIEPLAEVEVISGGHKVAPGLSAAALARLELPWLPTGVALNVSTAGRSTVVHREHDRLVSEDGRVAGRFDGLRLLTGEAGGDVTDEPGLLEVTFESRPTGPSEFAGRPMTAPEVVEVLRHLPTRTDSWLCAVSRTGKVVQMRWEDGWLWLETPDPEEATSTGKHATLDEAERMLAILAAEDRVAVGELDGVTTQPW
jgi:hypothetical protein